MIIHTITAHDGGTIVRTRNVAEPPFFREAPMKKALHPAAIAAAAVGLLAILGVLFVKVGNSDVHGVSMEDSMKITTGNKVNSMTGEPLTERQKVAAAQQDAMIQSMRAGGVDPKKSGTAPNFGGRQD